MCLRFAQQPLGGAQPSHSPATTTPAPAKVAAGVRTQKDRNCEQIKPAESQVVALLAKQAPRARLAGSRSRTTATRTPTLPLIPRQPAIGTLDDVLLCSAVPNR